MIRNPRPRGRHVLVLAAAAALGATVAGPGAASGGHDDGTIVFASNRAGGAPEVYRMDADGTDVRQLTFNDALKRWPRLSPDGARIAFTSDRAGGNFDIWVMNADGSNPVRITSDLGRDDNVAWTADGAALVYQHGPFSCPCELRLVNADGTNDRPLVTGPGSSIQGDPSPNNKRLAFASDAVACGRSTRCAGTAPTSVR